MKENYKILETRNISKEEYELITNLLDKYNMSKDNFIKNCKTLVINKIEYNYHIVDGYDPIKNIIMYNDKSNLVCEFLHVASSNRDKQLGICIRPNKVYKKSIGLGLNEGITDLFMTYCTNNKPYYCFERIVAKTLEYAFGIQIYNYYFLSDDAEFRFLFNRDYIKLLNNLDDYTYSMIGIRNLYLHDGKIPRGTDSALKIFMEVVIENLLNVVKDCGKDCKSYINELLKSNEMIDIYNIIGKYQYNS